MLEFLDQREHSIMGFGKSMIAEIIQKEMVAKDELVLDGSVLNVCKQITLKKEIKDVLSIRDTKQERTVPSYSGIMFGPNDCGRSVSDTMPSICNRAMKVLKTIKNKFSIHGGLLPGKQLNSKEKEMQGESCPSLLLTEEELVALLQNVPEKVQNKEIRKEEVANGDHHYRIGNRVNNQRPCENHICELLSDDKVYQLKTEVIELIREKFLSFSIGVKECLAIFVKALFDNPMVKEAEEIVRKGLSKDSHGKIAQLHRVIENREGKIVGFGLRTIQKIVAWIRSVLEYDKDIERPGKEDPKDIRLREAWNMPYKLVAEHLAVRIPQLVTAP